MRKILTIWALVIAAIVFGGSGAGQVLAQGEILLLGDIDINETKAYHIYKEEPFDKLSEVQYLIGLVKESPYKFVRNDRFYSSRIAARFLNFKFKKVRKHIRTSEEFIDDHASYSQKTGKPFYIMDQTGVKYLAKYVFHNELKRLREHEVYVTRQARIYK